MKNRILAGVASAMLLATSAWAAPHERCDRDGCWTYDCDANGNSCHRHWISSSQTAPTGYQPGTAPGRNPGDQVCDSNGQNCHAVDAPPK